MTNAQGHILIITISPLSKVLNLSCSSRCHSSWRRLDCVDLLSLVIVDHYSQEEAKFTCDEVVVALFDVAVWQSFPLKNRLSDLSNSQSNVENVTGNVMQVPIQVPMLPQLNEMTWNHCGRVAECIILLKPSLPSGDAFNTCWCVWNIVTSGWGFSFFSNPNLTVNRG